MPTLLKFKYKGNDVAKVQKISENRFAVKKVYNKSIRLLGDYLYEDRILSYSKLTKHHKFLPIDDEYSLYDRNHEKLAIINVSTDKSAGQQAKYQWKVKNVCKKKYVGMSICNTNLAVGAKLRWSRKPNEYYWLPCSTDQEYVRVRNKYRQQWETQLEHLKAAFSQLNIKHLKLYEWLKDDIDSHLNDVPYGRFRQILLDAARESMQSLHDNGKRVYMMPFDPDCISLTVQDGVNLFDMYINRILNNNYPQIMTSGFKFNSRYPALNRVFQLNLDVQCILQNNLPGSAYFTECNSVIRYDPDFVNDKEFKFGKNAAEILPIVKYIASQNSEMIIINDAPLITSVPKRMLEVMDDKIQKKVLSETYYKQVLKLSQIVISKHNFKSAMISGLSIHMKTSADLRKCLCKLWELHCPLQQTIISKRTKRSNFISRLKTICTNYETGYSSERTYAAELRTIREECIIAILIHTNIFDSHMVSTLIYLVDTCINTNRLCGRLIAHRILEWIRIDESK